MFCTATREAAELQARPFGSSLDSLLEQEILQLPRFSDDEDEDDEEWDDEDEDWDDDDEEWEDDDDEEWDDEEEGDEEEE